MTRKIRLTPYDDEAIDEYAANPDYRDYGSPPSTAMQDSSARDYSAREYSAPEDRMPLFLANEADQPMPRGFGSRGEPSERRPLWPRIFKASMFTAAAAGIALAIASMDNPLALFANAKASLPGMSAGQSSAATPAPALQSVAHVQTSPPPVAAVAPSRDEIAAALRSAQPQLSQAAQQSPPEIAQPKAVAPPPRRLEADELANLLKRAKALMAIGDISPARLLLERAADAQEASAALLLAQTYDPAVLGVQDLRSITPDPEMARAWYQKAAQLGSPDAQQRLAQLQN